MEPDRKLVRAKVEEDAGAVREGEGHHAARLLQGKVTALVTRTAAHGRPFLFMATQAYLAINNIEVIYDHVILVLRGVSLEVPGRPDRRAARRQRRRQDDDAEGDLQPAARRARRRHQGPDPVRRRAHRPARPRGAGEARHLPGDGRPPLLRAPHGGGEPAHRRATRAARSAPACRRTWRRSTSISRA